MEDRFEQAGGYTVGLEEEVLLLEPDGLMPVAAGVSVEILSRRPGGGRGWGSELPAAQLEIATRAYASAGDVLAELASARRALAEACAGAARPVATPVHPLVSVTELTSGSRYAALGERYGTVIRRQLVSSLQVHVAVGGAKRTLGVYNALRLLLPELTALAANAPFYEGVDTRLASIRPCVAAQLPRQGIPPRVGSLEWLGEELAWGARAGAVTDFSWWWWELRPHVAHGTLEVRVPDVQTTLAEAAGVVGFVQALVATLAGRFDAGERAPAVPSWRIEENRWAALRGGVEGQLADLVSGAPRPARERLRELVGWVEGAAEELGCSHLLEHTRALIDENGAMRQRALAGEAAEAQDVQRVLGWMAERFLLGVDEFAAR